MDHAELTPHWEPEITEDGSFTFFSQEFGETFHSRAGAKAEAFEKFAKATDLAEQATRGSLHLLDVCYGLGYNTAAALETIWAVNPDCRVRLVGLELDATVPVGAIAPALLAPWSPLVQTVLRELAQHHHYQTETLTAELWIGDARQTIQRLAQQGFQADAIFFDPFSPRRCPQLWTVEFFQQTARCLSPGGKLATYSRSASVRSAMLAAGLQIGTIPFPDAAPRPSHEWAQGTVGSFTPDRLHPLSPLEQEHLHTRAAVPLRDPGLQGTAVEILERHQQEQSQSGLESTTSWRRRWEIR
jgi:tRNA U34 5-methylaminomethyl-2-thiouridine-forming methyltransferase MnmC